MANTKNVHGAIVHVGSVRKDSLIRVTLKAVILDRDGDQVEFINADSYEKSDLWTERQIYMFSKLAKSRIS